MHFYKHANTYVLATGESPKGFENVLYVAWSGENADSVMECVLSADNLSAMTSVELPDVPDNWYNALSNASGLFAKRAAEPEPEPEPEPDPEPEPEPELWSVTLSLNDLVLIALGWFTWSALKYSLIWPITGAF